MGKLKILLLIGIGYVLGAKAGRARYEQIKHRAKQFANNPTVQNTAAKAQETVVDTVTTVAGAAASKVMPGSGEHAADDDFPADPAQPR